MITKIIISLFLLTSLTHAASFNELRGKIYDSARSNLPQYQGVSGVQLACALALRAVRVRMGKLIGRSQATFDDRSNVRPREVKLLHPRGVTAEATWKITEHSGYGGLFAKGTDVRAFVRFSSGTAASAYTPDGKRIFGMAVMLFPTLDLDRDVEAKSILMLDQNAAEGGTRSRFLASDNNDDEVFFSNHAPARSRLTRLANWFFGWFDVNPSLRTLKHVAMGGPAPLEIHLIPRITRADGKVFSATDFRDELTQYDAGDIVFDIVLMDGHVIGTLEIGKPVVSEFGELELHFSHEPT